MSDLKKKGFNLFSEESFMYIYMYCLFTVYFVSVTTSYSSVLICYEVTYILCTVCQ